MVLLEARVQDANAPIPLLSRVTPCTRGYAAAELGSGAAMQAMVSAGVLRELPAHCSEASFREIFESVSIVSRTGVAVQSHGKGVVHLATPSGSTVRVSTALYEVLRRSTTGTVPIPTVIDRVAPKWGDPWLIIREIIDSLRALISSGAVVLVETIEAAPFVPPRFESVGAVDDEVLVGAPA